MARPTTEKKGKTIKLRISEEMYEELTNRGKNMSDTVRWMLKSYIEGFVPHKSNQKAGKTGHSIDLSDETYESLMGMISFYGGSLENLVVMLDEAMNEGSVVYEDGKIVGVPQVNLEALYDKCHEANIDPQEAIDRLVKEMER